MKKLALATGVLCMSVLLAACGGGGGTSGGGYTPPTPTPTATPTPSTVTFSGNVTQLAGSLAHNPTPCATATAVPCPNPGIPATPMPTPAAGAPIAGANVYVTTASGVFTNGAPSPVLAQATTGPDGSFTTSALQVSAFNGGKAGIVVLNGSTISATNGLTDKGFAVLHTQVTPSGGNVVVPNLEIDTLSSDETPGAPEVETVRKNKGLQPVAVDEYALETARWSVQDNDGAGTSQCAIGMGPIDTLYAALGGVGSVNAFGNAANPTLVGAIDSMYQNPSANEVWGAAVGPSNEADCGPSQNGVGAAYYQMLTVTQ